MRFINMYLVALLSLGTIAHPAIGTAGEPRAGEQSPKAKGQAKAKDNNKGKDNDKDRIIVVDRDGHHRVIREYVTRGNLPPGLAKRRALPPGLAKQLRETGELPPGLQPYFVTVPQDVVVRLPAIPAYYHRYFAGNDLIVIDTRTNRIVLLIRDLL